ncbi:MAG: NADPH-dependent 7-cyano-7-deazaguanine reductase QueF [Burkholderiaceae bacterium]|nr:MAG: NADPH-dependent 7-cyano-7-deazaguanine reductase QueF [Burkholderiaceae bacterium]|tara:strand:+ start:139 stop:525 length:387 start_codon:yes stop_codon:yes gene_type:complete
MALKKEKNLQTFPNPNLTSNYTVKFEIPEFTCICPLTSQPDFAVIQIEYVPDLVNVELKSLKSYFWAYRDEAGFHESVTNRIMDDLVVLLSPRYLKIIAKWNVRGGIYTTVEIEKFNNKTKENNTNES